jgi:hypothetical protein
VDRLRCRSSDGLANPTNLKGRLGRLVVGFVCLVVSLGLVGVVGNAAGLDEETGFGGAAWQFASLFVLGMVIFYITPRAFETNRVTR